MQLAGGELVLGPAPIRAHPTWQSTAGCPFSIGEGTDPAVIVALLEAHVKVDHAPASAPKPKPIERPQVAAGETSVGWDYFTTRWRAYSRASKLAGADLGIQLLECLEPGLRKDLTRTTRGPTPIEEMKEGELLAAIRAMAVMQDSCLVATFAMARMTQDRGESCRSFASRLPGSPQQGRKPGRCSMSALWQTSST